MGNVKLLPSQIDTLIIAGKHDIALLRHFLRSHKEFSKLGGQTHLFIWRSEKYLLDQIQVSEAIKIWYKDDIPEMIEDDFRNQMFIKLVADRFIKTEWFWIADADYLICDDIYPHDFFNSNGVAYWFYRAWDGGPPEQRWRIGTEQFMRATVPYLFLDEAQFLMNTNILRDFRKSYDIQGMLHQFPMPADCLAYGAFAFMHSHQTYDWIDLGRPGPNVSIAYKVNQQPPSYCVLDSAVNLADVPPAKYYVFWSYWELAEQKMKEFLVSAVENMHPGTLIQLESSEINVRISADSLAGGGTEGIRGLHLDGWVHRQFKLLFANNGYAILRVRLDVPGRPAAVLTTSLQIRVNESLAEEVFLQPGENVLDIKLLLIHSDNFITLVFKNGIPEPNGNRELFARLVSLLPLI